MNLDRSSIERIDFPLATPGYERASVDAHLRAIADEVEALRRSGFRPAERIGASTADQVRTVLDAAEEAAASIRRQAEEEAEALLREARARAQAGNHERPRPVDITRMTEALAHVSQAMGAMLQGVGELTSELQALASSTSAPAREPPPPHAETPGDADGGGHNPVGASDPGPAPAAQIQPLPPPEPLPPAGARPMPDGPRLSTQREDARLIALNMALNRTPRDEIERYLATHFDLPDRESVLEDVYRRIGS